MNKSRFKYAGWAVVICACMALMVAAGGCSRCAMLTASDKILHSRSIANFAGPGRWQNDIEKFRQTDACSPVSKGAVLFVGSSSIRLWDTAKCFSDIKTINRGFGGSFISDSVFYADRIVLPYAPKTIVFYAGDNDIAAGKSPDMVLADFKTFVYKVQTALPRTKIIYIPIKPSTARWNVWPAMLKANTLIYDYCRSCGNLKYLDITGAMLGTDGNPRSDLLAADGLHLNEKGYELWSSRLKPYLH